MKMKDSGIEWIGEIPEHWEMPKVKSIFKIGRGRVIAKTELDFNGIYPVFSSQTKSDGILGYINTYDFERPQLTWTTDGANAGTVFLRDGKYNCTNVCGTLLPKNNFNELKFLKYSLEYVSLFNKRGDINGFKIMNNEMANIYFPIPPLPEQQKIANFLDDKTATIERIIELTKKSIEEYKSYKKSLITETVTKGLNPDVKMKDSGIDWIGEIPEHWEVTKPHRVSKIIRGNCNFQKNDLRFEGDFVALQYGKTYKVDEVNKDFNFYIDKSFYKENQLVKLGDTVFISTSETIEDLGHCCFYNRLDYDGLLGGEQMSLKPIDSIVFDKFLYYATSYFKNELNQYATGLKVFRFRADDLKKINIIIPPIDEQKQIVFFLDEKIPSIDKLIEQKERLISELETYKKSMIFEYVTGKKEVL